MRTVPLSIIEYLKCFVIALLFHQTLNCQVEPGNKIRVDVNAKINKQGDGSLMYEYSVTNSSESRQDVWIFKLIFSFSPDSIAKIFPIRGWWAPVIPIDGPPFWISYGAPESFRIKPNNSESGFGFITRILPGIIDYYTEGFHEAPNFPEGMAPDSIPGYDDLTPFGPGIVGKTVGPVLPPANFVALAFLDTLLSYTRQSAELGWLGKDRDNDCDDDEKPEDGVVRNIEQRLKKAKGQLERGDSVLARRELEKLVSKVERLWKRSQDEDKKEKRDRWEKRDRVVMTSEAYALLKYNTEYLIDRLPDRKPKKGSKEKD